MENYHQDTHTTIVFDGRSVSAPCGIKRPLRFRGAVFPFVALFMIVDYLLNTLLD